MPESKALTELFKHMSLSFAWHGAIVTSSVIFLAIVRNWIASPGIPGVLFIQKALVLGVATGSTAGIVAALLAVEREDMTQIERNRVLDWFKELSGYGSSGENGSSYVLSSAMGLKIRARKHWSDYILFLHCR